MYVTILVFLAALVQLNHYADNRVRYQELQSLFFWQLQCNNNQENENVSRNLVTILVFLAALVQHEGQDRKIQNLREVTILVFLAALVQRKNPLQEKKMKIVVTILVFLAALVQPTRRMTWGCLPAWSYNPCFSGSSSATEIIPWAIDILLTRYNPCFSGSSSATYHTILSRHRNPRYNPCFSGSSSATQQAPCNPSECACVTILVFLAALVQRKKCRRLPLTSA